MIQWLVKVKRFVFGYELTPEEKEEHRREMVRRKAYILGAGAGCAMPVEEDGLVRVRHLHSDVSYNESSKKGSNGRMKLVLRAASFAAKKHSKQRRKDADVSPYINHPLQVAEILATIGGIDDEEILAAALLHDTVEDTKTSPEELREAFGDRVTDIVLEVTDDKNLKKQERKRLQVEHAPHKSDAAKQLKIADKIANLRGIISNPPTGWDEGRKADYFAWAKDVFQGLKGVNPDLDAEFESTHARWKTAH